MRAIIALSRSTVALILLLFARCARCDVGGSGFGAREGTTKQLRALSVPSVDILTPWRSVARPWTAENMVRNLDRVAYDGADVRLIILDQAPRPTSHMLLRKHPKIQYHFHNTTALGELSVGSARNYLGCLATADIVVQMDSDDFFMPDYVATMVAPLIVRGGKNALLSAPCNKSEVSVTTQGDLHFECNRMCVAGDGGAGYKMLAGLIAYPSYVHRRFPPARGAGHWNPAEMRSPSAAGIAGRARWGAQCAARVIAKGDAKRGCPYDPNKGHGCPTKTPCAKFDPAEGALAWYSGCGRTEEEFDFFATFDMAAEGDGAHGTRGWRACMDAPYFKQQPELCEVWARYRRLKLDKKWKYAKGCDGKRFCPPAVAALPLSHLAFTTIWKSSTTWQLFGSDGVQGTHLTFSSHMEDYKHAWKLLDALAGRGGIHGTRRAGSDPAAFCHQPAAARIGAATTHAPASTVIERLKAQNRELRRKVERYRNAQRRRSERVMKVVARESKRLGDVLMRSTQDD